MLYGVFSYKSVNIIYIFIYSDYMLKKNVLVKNTKS